MKELHLPFSPTNQLRDELIRHYLIPSIDWLSDSYDKTSTTVLPAKLGNLWETAYVILCLLRAKNIIESNIGFKGDYIKRISDSVDFLLDRVREDRDTANWDGGLYDTAVVTRALIEFIKTYPEDANASRASTLIDKSLIWIFKEVQGWETERYSLGLADLSQTLRVVLQWEDYRQEIDINVFLRNHGLEVPTDIDDFVAKLLIKQLSPEASISKIDNKTSESENTTTIQDLKPEIKKKQSIDFQSDIWNTSEAILGLTSYFFKHKGDTNFIPGINDILRQSIRYLETEHTDGKWGLPDVTSLALMAYLRGYSTVEDVEPEPHIVFKTIRWLCDSKQRFSDGSILHSTNHTIFFSLVLIEIFNHWLSPGSLRDISVIDIYDYVLWQMPARTTVERAKRLETQFKLAQEKSMRVEMETQNAKILQRLRRWQIVTFSIFWALIGVFFSIAFGFVQIQSAKITEIALPQLGVVSWEVLLTFLSIWSSLGILMVRRIITPGDSQAKRGK